MPYGSQNNDQVITYRNLPAHTDLNYELPSIFQARAIIAHLDGGAGCLGGFTTRVGTCSDLTGSGHVHIIFDGDSGLLVNSTRTGTTTASIGSLSLQATGTITASAKADMAVSARSLPNRNTWTAQTPGRSRD